MPKKHKRLSPADSHARDLAMVACRPSGLISIQIALRFKLTAGRVTQILHRVADRLAPHTPFF